MAVHGRTPDELTEDLDHGVAEEIGAESTLDTDDQSGAPDAGDGSSPEEDEARSLDGDEASDAPDGMRRWRPRTPLGLAAVTGVIMIVLVAALAGWAGFRAYQSRQAEQQRLEFLAVGKQGAIDLTTIDYRHADEDVQRILNAATGEFYDDFNKRSQPFVDVVKQVQSTSEGTVTSAGIESDTPQGADVLVAVTVKTSSAGAPQGDPRSWRMRISVQRVGDQTKVANVSFVP